MIAVDAQCKLGTEIRQLKGRHPVLSHGHWNYQSPRSDQLSKPSRVEASDSKLSTFPKLYLRWSLVYQRLIETREKSIS